MRERTVNSKAVNKTLNYLNALYNKCNGDPEFKGISNSYLQTFFNINKSTYASCRDLGIVIEHEDYTEWNNEYPSRQTALQILDNLLHRRKKPTADVPILPDFVTPLNAIVEKLTNLSKNNFNRLEPIKTPQKEVSLFSDQEKKDQQRFELIKAIASNVYDYNNMGYLMSENDLTSIKMANKTIIAIADDLLSQIK